MDSQTVTQEQQAVQHSLANTDSDSQLDPAAKEVVQSAPLPRNFYRGPRPGRRLVFLDDNENWARRVTEVSALR
jgi:hypothetical protein